MKTLFVLNPGSKGGSSVKRFARIQQLISQCGIEAELVRTESLEDAKRLCIAGHEAGVDAIVAVGGDGTINQVLQGMYHEDGTRRSAAAMGVVYTGTSPDFCKSYGIPLDHEAAMHLIAARRSRQVSVGRICMNDEHGLPRVAFFGCCANIGLGAQLARRANGGIRQRLGDTIGTFVCLLQTIGAFTPVPLQLTFDGSHRDLEAVWNLSVGRTRLIASGIKVCHDLRPDDDRFYLMTVKQMTLGKWPAAIRTVYSGKAVANTEFLSLEHGSCVELASPGGCVEVEIDGDPAGYLPCRIEAAQHPLELISEGDAC